MKNVFSYLGDLYRLIFSSPLFMSQILFFRFMREIPGVRVGLADDSVFFHVEMNLLVISCFCV